MLQALVHIDHQLFYWINTGWANKVLDVIFPILRNKWTWVPFYIIAGIFVLVKYKRNGWRILIMALLLILCSDQLTSVVIKPLIGRLRPCNNSIMHVRLVVDSCGAGFSMPSSHAANHFAIAVFMGLLFYRKSKYLLPMLLVWAFLVSISQIYVGVHYPADVTIGALWGALLGCIAFWSSRYVLSKNGFQAKTQSSLKK